jgi:hypothetical protein
VRTTNLGAECFGTIVEVICPLGTEFLVANCFPLGSVPCIARRADHTFRLEVHPNQDNVFLVRCGDAVPACECDIEAALTVLRKEIHFRVAEFARTHIFIHAGVVRWNGQCLLLPGYSHAGKSTLVWHLVQRGAVYYSDEYAVVDCNGRVHPLTLPIALRSETGRRTFISPIHVEAIPVLPSIVAFVQYSPSAAWHPRRLRPSETVVQLISHSVGIRRNPEKALSLLKTIGLQAESFIGDRSKPSEITDWLNDTFGDAQPKTKQ